MPKKRGAPKGGWKKAKEAALAGNKDFSLADPVVKQNIQETVIDFAPITQEDIALDQELEQLAAKRPQVSDSGPAPDVQKARETLDHLAEHMDGEYMPASTMAELQEQVHQAKQFGADSIDGTEALIKQIFRNDFDKIKDSIGFGIYHDIRVYIHGKFESLRNAGKLSMQQKLFPNG